MHLSSVITDNQYSVLHALLVTDREYSVGRERLVDCSGVCRQSGRLEDSHWPMGWAVGDAIRRRSDRLAHNSSHRAVRGDPGDEKHECPLHRCQRAERKDEYERDHARAEIGWMLAGPRRRGAHVRMGLAG